jgi:NADPH-dependent glutamate synthase beta subunit-like oxidoreductase
LGNVTLGRDVSAAELRDRYDGVVLAYGAEDDRHLGVPGEVCDGSLSACSLTAPSLQLPLHKGRARKRRRRVFRCRRAA